MHITYLCNGALRSLESSEVFKLAIKNRYYAILRRINKKY